LQVTTESLFRLEKPAQIRPAIARKLQEKVFSMATMRDVPDVSRQEVAVRAWHPVSLEGTFRPQKRASKLLSGAFYANLKLPWSTQPPFDEKTAKLE
jgi:hypothetical protein